MLRIFIRSAEKTIFSCEWVDGLEENHSAGGDRISPVLLSFNRVAIYEDIEIQRKTSLVLCFAIEGISDFGFGEFDIENTSHLSLKKQTQNIFAMFDVAQNVDLLKFRILRAWADGQENFHWSSFGFGCQQGSWLRACLSWKKSPLRFDNLKMNSTVMLTLRDFDSQESFYCGLGEAVLGRFGYMGQDLDGFRECLGILLKANFQVLHFRIVGASDEKIYELFGRHTYLEDMREIVVEFGGKFDLTKAPA